MTQELKKIENKTIKGIVFYEDSSDIITEVFGMPDELRHKIAEKFLRWLAFEDHKSMTEAFSQFLESDVFEKIGFTPKTNNDYLMLGYIFSGTVEKYRSTMGCNRKEGIGISLRDLLRS